MRAESEIQVFVAARDETIRRAETHENDDGRDTATGHHVKLPSRDLIKPGFGSACQDGSPTRLTAAANRRSARIVSHARSTFKKTRPDERSTSARSRYSNARSVSPSC